jgi:hypothetical protein
MNLLTGPRPRGEPERTGHRPHQPLRRLAHRVADAISEANYAQQRLYSLRTAYDRYALEPDVPPEHFAEFLLRSSGVLRHEPSATQRLAAKHIRS